MDREAALIVEGITAKEVALIITVIINKLVINRMDGSNLLIIYDYAVIFHKEEMPIDKITNDVADIILKEQITTQ